METYKIKNLSFTYPQKDKPAISNINFVINAGEFITICGKSGSGKSTLLRQLKTILAPHGKRQGEIYFHGKLLEQVDQLLQTSQIGYVLQSPENQIVTDKVWHELAFGLESLGYDNSTIRLRVAEMASFFGIHTWFHKNISELSGGQKQLLNLASIMTMQPEVLIVDEPTSQLDPIAALEFLKTLKKINSELGTTIIMTEHRLEEVIPMSDRVVVMEKGCIIADDNPQNVGKQIGEMDNTMIFAMTSPMRIYSRVKNDLICPVTVKDGRKWLDTYFDNKTVENLCVNKKDKSGADNVVIKLKDVWFKYSKNMPDIIKGLSLEVKEGEFFCIVGGNGTGKTTALSIISGLNKHYRGKVIINGKNIEKICIKDRYRNNIGVLPQNPQTLFVKKTVEMDLYEMLSDIKLTKEEKKVKVRAIADMMELNELLQMHPYDLSGGEQQKAALAKVLLLEPKILLLDEPTKGIDDCFKQELAKILRTITKKRTTIVMVSHDIEFCAEYADTCGLFFDGNIITKNTTKKFFAGNSFYTTAANRMARHICPEAVTVEDVISLCQKNI
ncbi:ATP-binding cassette domain-containing protein [Clostridium tagluense]|uniref:ABC transporter ATP-binding protein n=1 Tax=Clostridium tagluense TaxID=360422 RepID=UPI001C0BB174|nr:ATP-binding cassette domain-containing protein [Clostridium tagluense]MBU3129529.1 ATP-binding cassette domain-containing protein [Clostridium tagluense]MCB2310893.1 ATP-binding cassette domain-containing protein [Clostridium tagluense]MCB2315747.1 ATP-binding cassette domain-containing protein [Clostridium tagluense]MCB2320609.1 ATP-binding cassette domain-containing protein [Clostridium tagluense]MCB2325486.1 ATP-binding cassette domain-containing protein [Clostridium tagluense]